MANFGHPLCSKIVTISGKEGSDSQRYQTRQVKEPLEEIKQNEKGI
jgi:hypothetical protein